MIKTSSWFTPLPADHQPVGISRGTPRGQAAGYRLYKKLAPGTWFKTTDVEEYYRRYRSEILAPLDPRHVVAELARIGNGRVPVLLCYERAHVEGHWCHRAMVAEWLMSALGEPVPEFGYETLAQELHPLMPNQLRRPIAVVEIPDVTPYIGRETMIDGELHRVASASAEFPGQAVITVGDRRFTTSFANVSRLFTEPA